MNPDVNADYQLGDGIKSSIIGKISKFEENSYLKFENDKMLINFNGVEFDISYNQEMVNDHSK